MYSARQSALAETTWDVGRCTHLPQPTYPHSPKISRRSHWPVFDKGS